MMTTTEATPIMIPTMVKKDRNLWLIIELIANFQFCIRSPFPACYLRRSLHSGYGSEENYEYLEMEEMMGYVKYNWFHIEVIGLS